MSNSTENRSVQSYVVEGMTCSHCVASVQEEVSEVTGVEAVEVSLSSGELKVTTGSDGVSDDAVRAAVELAGYTVVKS